MKGNQRSFVPFNLDAVKLSDALTDITPKSGFFKSTVDYKTLLATLNKASQNATKNSRYSTEKVPLKLMQLLDETLDKIIDEKYNSII